MAKLKGADGTIVIDSDAANADMQKINESAALLHEARDLFKFKSTGIDNARFSGNAFAEFESQMNRLDSALNSAEWEASAIAGGHPAQRVGIKQIVEAYQEADQRIKNMATGGSW